MKTAIAMSVFISLFIFSFAGIIVVDNNPGATGQYSSLQEAIDASLAGDTIYVNGSPVSYGNVATDKKLILIGPGRNPQKDGGIGATVGNIFLSPGSDGTVINGFTGSVVNGEVQVDDITILGSRFAGITIVGANYIIENCIISTGSLVGIGTIMVGAGNILIQNNIINGGISNFNSATVYIRNNVFVQNRDAFALSWSVPVYNAIVENNIFYGRGPANCSSCTFNNNLTFGTSLDSINGSDNIIAVNPEFVNVPLPGGINLLFSFNYDWSLGSSSPGLGKGSDGKDVGLYGGAGSYSAGGEPAIPQIQKFTLKNPTVPPGGELEIEVISTSGK